MTDPWMWPRLCGDVQSAVGWMMELHETHKESELGANQPRDRKDIIRADITKRLRSICSNFSDEEFASLVEKMTEQKLRSERRTS